MVGRRRSVDWCTSPNRPPAPQRPTRLLVAAFRQHHEQSQQDFDDLLRQFIDDCHPETPAQTSAVTHMAIAHWSIRRVHRIETNILKVALANVGPEITDPGDRTAAAWKQATLVSVFNKLAGFEGSYVTQFARAVELYCQLRRQASQPPLKQENEHSNPLDEILMLSQSSREHSLQRRPKVSQPQRKHENHHSNPLNEILIPPQPPPTAPPDPPKPRPPSHARASSLVIVHNELRI